MAWRPGGAGACRWTTCWCCRASRRSCSWAGSPLVKGLQFLRRSAVRAPPTAQAARRRAGMSAWVKLGGSRPGTKRPTRTTRMRWMQASFTAPPLARCCSRSATGTARKWTWRSIDAVMATRRAPRVVSSPAARGAVGPPPVPPSPPLGQQTPPADQRDNQARAPGPGQSVPRGIAALSVDIACDRTTWFSAVGPPPIGAEQRPPDPPIVAITPGGCRPPDCRRRGLGRSAPCQAPPRRSPRLPRPRLPPPRLAPGQRSASASRRRGGHPGSGEGGGLPPPGLRHRPADPFNKAPHWMGSPVHRSRPAQ